MTEHRKRLNTIRAHLRTGAVGQREVWEEWLTEAAAEIEQLTAERDLWRERAERMFWLLPDDIRLGEIQARRALEPKP